MGSKPVAYKIDVAQLGRFGVYRKTWRGWVEVISHVELAHARQHVRELLVLPEYYS